MNLIGMNPLRSIGRPARALLFSAVLCALALVLLSISCGRGASCTGATPVPKLSSVTPTAIDSLTLPAGLTLSGSGFVSWSTAYLNSVNLASSTRDSHHIYATVTWQNLSAAGVSTGTVYISVTNAGQPMGDIFGCPNGGDSQILPITIQ